MSRKNIKYSVCKVCQSAYLKREPKTKQLMCDSCESKVGICTVCSCEMPLYSKKNGFLRLTCSQTCHNRRISSDPVVVAKMAETMSGVSLEMWSRPEYRERQLRNLEKIWGSEEFKKAKRNAFKSLWENSEYREKMSKISREMWEQPGRREAYSEIIKARWENREYRERSIASMTIAQNDPELNKRRSITLKRVLGTYEHRKHQSEITRERWASGLMDNRPRVAVKNTGIEIAIRDALVNLGIYEFSTRHIVGRFRLDIAFVEISLDVECDGEYWHNLPGIPEKDARRNAYLQSLGWSVIRLREKEILANANRVVCEKVIPTLLTLLALD